MKIKVFIVLSNDNNEDVTFIRGVAFDLDKAKEIISKNCKLKSENRPFTLRDEVFADYNKDPDHMVIHIDDIEDFGWIEVYTVEYPNAIVTLPYGPQG